MGGTYSSSSEYEISSLPLHWRAYKGYNKRENLEYIYTLLNGYEEHLNRILSKTGSTEEYLALPKSTDDKDFDESVLKSCQGRVNIPSTKTRDDANRFKADMKELLDKNISIKSYLEEEKEINLHLKQEIERLGNGNSRQDIELPVDKRSVTQQETEGKCHSQERSKRMDKGVSKVKDQHSTPEWKRLEPNQEETRNNEMKNLWLELQKERTKVLELSQNVKEIQKEKEQLLVRLSHAVGSKLTSNNPAIADLSDENRPNKLAERFGQIYDNEWTDAFEELTQQSLQVKEEVAIDFLLRTVMTAYLFCSQFRCMFLDMGDCCTILTCDDPTGMRLLHRFGLQDSATIELEKNAKRILHINKRNIISEVQKNFLATMTDMMQDLADHDEKCRIMAEEEVEKTESLKHTFLESTTDVKLSDTTNALKSTEVEGAQSLPEAAKGSSDEQGSMSARDSRSQVETVTTKEEQKQAQTAIPGRDMSPSLTHKFVSTIRYAEQVAELCWLMQTSKPALHLSATIPDSGAMDKNLFKAYTKTGPRIDYIVWPVMYLYENGPLLSQGVAQPKR
uniref:Uncharacterized protein LOC111126856 isoform X2 n=1 Tax=Crassostrea virginica TaxID=6565 RepID=A0A8B8DH50_CRAVI|nr:uncharacterized protein LOC111126856 isoform X2 [Crassostrea virginica]